MQENVTSGSVPIGVGLLIRINNEALVEELCGHYRRSGFSAEPVGGAMVEVHAPVVSRLVSAAKSWPISVSGTS